MNRRSILYIFFPLPRLLPCLALPCLALPCLALPCLASFFFSYQTNELRRYTYEVEMSDHVTVFPGASVRPSVKYSSVK